jgi:hypothetical protein
VLERFRRPVGLVLAALVAAASRAGAAEKSPPSKSPHVEIVARAEVVSAPRRNVHKSGRKFLEFEVTLDAYVLASDQPDGADLKVPVDMEGKVKVVHDLSCGGDDLVLASGDRVDLQGEYVEIPGGPDLIHFTHASAVRAGCGRGDVHPGGYLRKVVPATPTPIVTPPRPAGIVPDQPYVGTPAAREPYAAILRMKEAGASDEKLLEAVRAGKKRYALSTFDIQRLRASGVSPEVIEAMLQSGRVAVTALPTPSPTPVR